MQTNKILSADILDLLFDNRNKEYGAYELRRSYKKRITKAVLITTCVAVLAFTSNVLARSLKNKTRERLKIQEVEMTNIKSVEKPPEKLPELQRRPEPQVRTLIFTPPQIVKEITEPPPTVEDLDSARIDVVKKDGIPDVGTVQIKKPDENRGIIEERPSTESNEPVSIVEIQAKFVGNWENFLRKNLNAQVPLDNGAKPGNYTIIIQFVVDKEGNVSEIKPLTDLGYGMEQEAIRVLKKATKWEPAIQNGYPVKAYHRQPITFQVLEEE